MALDYYIQARLERFGNLIHVDSTYLSNVGMQKSLVATTATECKPFHIEYLLSAGEIRAELDFALFHSSSTCHHHQRSWCHRNVRRRLGHSGPARLIARVLVVPGWRAG